MLGTIRRAAILFLCLFLSLPMSASGDDEPTLQQEIDLILWGFKKPTREEPQDPSQALQLFKEKYKTEQELTLTVPSVPQITPALWNDRTLPLFKKVAGIIDADKGNQTVLTSLLAQPEIKLTQTQLWELLNTPTLIGVNATGEPIVREGEGAKKYSLMQLLTGRGEDDIDIPEADRLPEASRVALARNVLQIISAVPVPEEPGNDREPGQRVPENEPPGHGPARDPLDEGEKDPITAAAEKLATEIGKPELAGEIEKRLRALNDTGKRYDDRSKAAAWLGHLIAENGKGDKISGWLADGDKAKTWFGISDIANDTDEVMRAAGVAANTDSTDLYKQIKDSKTPIEARQAAREEYAQRIKDLKENEGEKQMYADFEGPTRDELLVYYGDPITEFFKEGLLEGDKLAKAADGLATLIGTIDDEALNKWKSRQGGDDKLGEYNMRVALASEMALAIRGVTGDPSKRNGEIEKIKQQFLTKAGEDAKTKQFVESFIASYDKVDEKNREFHRCVDIVMDATDEKAMAECQAKLRGEYSGQTIADYAQHHGKPGASQKDQEEVARAVFATFAEADDNGVVSIRADEDHYLASGLINPEDGSLLKEESPPDKDIRFVIGHVNDDPRELLAKTAAFLQAFNGAEKPEHFGGEPPLNGLRFVSPDRQVTPDPVKTYFFGKDGFTDGLTTFAEQQRDKDKFTAWAEKTPSTGWKQYEEAKYKPKSPKEIKAEEEKRRAEEQARQKAAREAELERQRQAEKEQREQQAGAVPGLNTQRVEKLKTATLGPQGACIKCHAAEKSGPDLTKDDPATFLSRLNDFAVGVAADADGDGMLNAQELENMFAHMGTKGVSVSLEVRQQLAEDLAAYMAAK